jgi:hypothetical protein
MIERGGFDVTADDTGQHVWLTNIPAHVRDATMSSSPNLAPSAQAGKPQSSFLTVAQLLAAPPTRYIVQDLLPERGLVAIYGAPGAGKSFLAMDLAFAIASGASAWFGRRLTQAPIAYIALESQGGMRNRVKAWISHTGTPAPGNIRFFTRSLSLLDSNEASELGHGIRNELGAGAVTVIDTLSRASPGADENAASDMTSIIANAESLGCIAEGPVIVVHHTGKEAGKGLRGHSSLLGAVEASIEVVNSGGNRSWAVKKNKDGSDGDFYAFELVSYPVETNQWGGEVRSCAVRPLTGAGRPSLPPVTGSNQLPIITAVRREIMANPAGISWDRAVVVAAATLSVSSGRRTTVAKSTLTNLIEAGHLQRSNDKICLP